MSSRKLKPQLRSLRRTSGQFPSGRADDESGMAAFRNSAAEWSGCPVREIL